MNNINLDKLIAEAESGSTPKQIELGHSFLTGLDYQGNEFPKDFDKAKFWLEKAHEKGAFTATVLLGTIYQEGKGMPVDILKTINLYEVAAERGAYLPCIYLARIYAQGEGVNASSKLASKWYKKALSFEGKVDDKGEMKEARNYLKKV